MTDGGVREPICLLQVQQDGLVLLASRRVRHALPSTPRPSGGRAGIHPLASHPLPGAGADEKFNDIGMQIATIPDSTRRQRNGQCFCGRLPRSDRQQVQAGCAGGPQGQVDRFRQSAACPHHWLKAQRRMFSRRSLRTTSSSHCRPRMKLMCPSQPRRPLLCPRRAAINQRQSQTAAKRSGSTW